MISSLYLRSREEVADTEDTYDFFETVSCVMLPPKINALSQGGLGKNGQGEYGLKTELQACYTSFEVKCSKVSEVAYFMNFFFGKSDSVLTIDEVNSVYSHHLTHATIQDREIPTFTAIYVDGYETRVMTHCLITNFMLVMSTERNGLLEATFECICNMHTVSSGSIAEKGITTDWVSGEYSVEEEPHINVRGSRFYIGDSTKTTPLVHADISYAEDNLTNGVEISEYIQSVKITGSNGINGEDALRAGGYGVLNDVQRKDFVFTCELVLRKDRLSTVPFYLFADNDTQKALEIDFSGKPISDDYRYSFSMIFSCIQVDDISEDEGLVMQTTPLIIHSDSNGSALNVYVLSKIGIGYNAAPEEPEESFRWNIGAWQNNNIGAW